MDASTLVSQYLAEHSTMQLASVSGDQPWICTVWFVADSDRNLYWASLRTRRHSQEIEAHPQVASAIVVHNIMGEPVIGIQVQGTAALVPPSPNNRPIVENYAKLFHRSNDWADAFIAGQTEHALYKLTPSSIYLFDEKNFPGGIKQKVL